MVFWGPYWGPLIWENYHLSTLHETLINLFERYCHNNTHQRKATNQIKSFLLKFRCSQSMCSLVQKFRFRQETLRSKPQLRIFADWSLKPKPEPEPAKHTAQCFRVQTRLSRCTTAHLHVQLYVIHITPKGPFAPSGLVRRGACVSSPGS